MLSNASHKTVMNTLDSITADAAQSLLDYQVVDKAGSEVGTIHCLWADAHGGNLQFLGVKTGWLFGHNHVVPVEKTEVDEANRTVRIPYESDFVKGAPTIDASATISDEEEAEIYRYYGVQGGAVRTSTTARTHDAEQTEHSATAMAASKLAMNAAPRPAVAADTNLTSTKGDDIEVALSEEQVHVGKRTVDAGAVRLRKIIRTEIVNQPVEVRHEDFVVERISADQVHGDANAASDFQDETIDVPLTREEVVVSKEAHVTGAVRVNKTATTETQNVSETVRKEDVEVLRDGKTEVARDGKSSR